jgi:hypothetical protein
MGQFNSIHIPKVFGAFCPHCGEQVAFDLSNGIHDTERQSIGLSALCPPCGKAVHFFSLHNDGGAFVAVFMHPFARPRRTPENFWGYRARAAETLLCVNSRRIDDQELCGDGRLLAANAGRHF